MLVEQSIIGADWRLCWYMGVLKEHLGGFVGTQDYYRSTREVLLVQKVLYEHLGGCAGSEEYYMGTLETVLIQYDTVKHSRGAVLVQQRPIGARECLCGYGRVL